MNRRKAKERQRVRDQQAAETQQRYWDSNPSGLGRMEMVFRDPISVNGRLRHFKALGVHQLQCPRCGIYTGINEDVMNGVEPFDHSNVFATQLDGLCGFKEVRNWSETADIGNWTKDDFDVFYDQMPKVTVIVEGLYNDDVFELPMTTPDEELKAARELFQAKHPGLAGAIKEITRMVPKESAEAQERMAAEAQE